MRLPRVRLPLSLCSALGVLDSLELRYEEVTVQTLVAVNKALKGTNDQSNSMKRACLDSTNG